MDSTETFADPVRAHAPATDAAPTVRRGVVTGVAAGIVGIGCCVGPTVAALFGVMTAAAAADIADHLYAEWGWAFKVAGLVAGGSALLLARRRARSCGSGGRSLLRFALVVAGTGVATYFALYVTTTWLGNVAT